MKNNNFQTFEVELPSKGLNYPDDCVFKKGTVNLKYGTSKEETILMDSQLIRKGTVLDKLVQSLLIEDEDISKLFPGDFNSLVVNARISMYGTRWEIKIPCPMCGEQNKNVIDISEFNSFENTKEFEEGKFEFISSLKNKFKYKILTKKEASDYEKLCSDMKKKNLPYNQIAEYFFKTIISVNDETDKIKLKDYFETMSSVESREVREHILFNAPDINLSKEFSCPSCDHEWEADVPMDITFFWRPGSRKKRV